MLELKVPWSMSAISENNNRNHNILKLEDVFPNVSFTVSETERVLLVKIVDSKYELTDELPNDVRLKKTSALHGIKV